MAKQMQCVNSHTYSGNIGDPCPHCKRLYDDLDKTRIVSPPDTIPAKGHVKDDGRTTTIFGHLGTLDDPVVGWLACVEGPNLGSDWRLVAGRNSIGRSKDRQVNLDEDQAVSSGNHAYISYDPRRNAFSVLPGDSRGLVYCNGAEVAVATALNAYDRIEVGASTLVFVPLVGPQFQWTLSS